MKAKEKILWIVAILIVIVVLAGIYSYVGFSDRMMDNEELRVGVIMPLSGNAAYYGATSQKGIELARKNIAKEFPDLDLEVIYEDSKFLPQEGVNAYTKLREFDNVDAVITGASHISLAVKPLAEQDGILQVATFVGADSYSSPHDLSFRFNSKSGLDSVEIAKFIREQGFGSVGILYLQNDMGIAYRDTLKEELIRKSVTVVAEESFLLTDNDFRSILLKVEEEKPDIIFMVGIAANYGHILNQAKELAIETEFMAMWSAQDPVLLKIAGDSAEGLIYTYPFDTESENLKTKEFVETFREEHGFTPDAYASQNYEALRVTALAFSECGKDYVCIQRFIHGLDNYDSVFGRISFDKDGDIENEFIVKTVKNGKFVPL